MPKQSSVAVDAELKGAHAAASAVAVEVDAPPTVEESDRSLVKRVFS